MQMGLIKETNKFTEKNIIVPKTFTHSCAIGQTGCGKTSSYIYPNLEDRIMSDYSILAYDYKGKEHLNIKYFANKHDRLDDVIEIGKDWGKSINIIKYLTKANLEDLLLDLFGRSEKDIFWSRSSVNVCLAVLDILKITDNLCNLVKDINSNISIEAFIKDCIDFEFDPSYTLKSLLIQTRTVSTLKDFYNGFVSIYNCFSFICEELIKNENNDDLKIIEKKYISLYYELEKLLVVSRNSNKTLDFLINNKQDNTSISSLIMCINAPLKNISSLEYLNNDELDVIKALNENKIVVINVKSFSDLVLSSFNNSIFCELTKNSYRSNNPISIFIDEAQRVLSENFDVPVDVLRECKVELFLAFQNQELVIEKIGRNKFDSLLKNIKNRYLFRNPSLYENYDLSMLDIFEYFDDEKMDFRIYKSMSIFVSYEDSFDVEYIFQKIKNLKQKYTFSKYVKNSIMVYDESLFLNNQIVLRKKDGEEEIINIFNRNILKDARNIMNRHFFKYLDADIREELLTKKLKTKNTLLGRRKSQKESKDNLLIDFKKYEEVGLFDDLYKDLKVEE